MLTFDGVDDFLEYTGGALCTSYPYTMFALVAAPLDTNTEMACIAQGSSTVDAFHSAGFDTFGERRYTTDRSVANGSNRANDTSAPNISATVPRWLIAHYASAADRRVAFGNTTFDSDTTAMTSSISSLDRCLVGATRRSAGLLHFAKADIGEVWWCTGLPSNTEIDELIAYTRLPENLTGRVNGWYLSAFNSGGTYTSHTGGLTMTASGGVSASGITHPITRSSAATAVTMTGPSGGVNGVASTNFSIGANGTITGTVTVTPADGGAGGTFTPTSVNISSGTPTATFTYTPASTGAKTISATNNGSLTNPSNITYTVTAAAATSMTIALKQSDGTTAAASITGIEYAVLNASTVAAATSILDTGTGESTDGSGNLVLDITGLGVTVGQVRYVVAGKSNGTPGANFDGWQGPVTAA